MCVKSRFEAVDGCCFHDVLADCSNVGSVFDWSLHRASKRFMLCPLRWLWCQLPIDKNADGLTFFQSVFCTLWYDIRFIESTRRLWFRPMVCDYIKLEHLNIDPRESFAQALPQMIVFYSSLSIIVYYSNKAAYKITHTQIHARRDTKDIIHAIQ